MNLSIPFITGSVSLMSFRSLEEVGEVLSKTIFGGLIFEGKDLEIHEEVPAIFIQLPILGLKIVLDGYSGFDKGCGFNLSILPWVSFEGFTRHEIQLDNFLFHLLKKELKDFSDIEVLED